VFHVDGCRGAPEQQADQEKQNIMAEFLEFLVAIRDALLIAFGFALGVLGELTLERHRDRIAERAARAAAAEPLVQHLSRLAGLHELSLAQGADPSAEIVVEQDDLVMAEAIRAAAALRPRQARALNRLTNQYLSDDHYAKHPRRASERAHALLAFLHGPALD
jgi:hypothetical protein